MKISSKYTDQEIIKGLSSQDSTILTYVYKQNFRSVKKYIEENSGSETDAQDVFQDALILVYERIRKGNLILTCSFGTFLFAVAKTQWLNVLRQRKKRNIVTDACDEIINGDTDIYNDLIQAEKKKLFITHFNELTEDCKKIIQLFIKEFSITEITKLMNFSSEQHTKNRRVRCKNALINKIESNPRFKELSNGTVRKDNQIPRW
jgi:RNA polymerase sigma factor (sigma-70 family)